MGLCRWRRSPCFCGSMEALRCVLTHFRVIYRKRASAREPQLSTELAAIWTPLLSRLEDTYDGFLDVLITRMVDLLSLSTDPGSSTPPHLSSFDANLSFRSSDPSAGPQGVIDRSYPLTLSAWVIHLLQASEDPQTTEAVVRSCLLSGTPKYVWLPSHSAPRRTMLILRAHRSALALLDNLSKADDILAATVKPLIGVLRNSDAGLVRFPRLASSCTALTRFARRHQQSPMKMKRSTSWQKWNDEWQSSISSYSYVAARSTSHRSHR